MSGIYPTKWITITDGVVTEHEREVSFSSVWSEAFGEPYVPTSEVEALRKENERLTEAVDVAQEATKFARLDRDMYKAEVERLRKENERLREALRFYACRCEKPDQECAKGHTPNCGWTARAALQGETG